MRVADYFAQYLAEQGAQAAFMVSGGMMMHLMDAVGRVPSIRYYCNHHEQASAMAADAYARASGRIGLCYATSGPGATNILTGLVGAWQDSVPVFFLTGQCKVRDTLRGNNYMGLRQMGVFEVDILPIVSSVTKYAAFVDRAEDARYHMEKAYYLATTGRPGPVLLDVPLDVQGITIDPNSLPGFEVPNDAEPLPTDEAAVILDELRHAQRPLILAGHGVRSAGATDEFRSIVDRLGVPVVTTQMAKDLLHHSHPLFVGHLGIKGDRPGNFAVQTADVILILGSSLHIHNIGWEAELFAPSAQKIHVDPDEAVLRKTKPIVSKQFRYSVDRFLRAMNSRCSHSPPQHVRWVERCGHWKERYSSTKEPHLHCAMDGPCNLYEVMDVLSDVLVGNELILTDAGQPTYVVPQGLRLKAGQRYLVPGSLAEMGWALPAALGAAAAEPERTVVAIIGDGSLQTNIQELQTLHHYGFNIKLIIINNDGYASIRGTQNRFFDGFFVGSTKDSGVSLPNLQKIAAAYELSYVECQQRSELRERLSRTMAISGPVLCSISAQRDQDVVPAVGSERLPDGRMRSSALHRMSPLLSEEELDRVLSEDEM